MRYLFGTLTGDPTADEILAELRKSPAGLTRTELRDLFQRNKTQDEIAAALATLERLGKARSEKRTPEGGKGRPAEYWHVTTNDINDINDISPMSPTLWSYLSYMS